MIPSAANYVHGTAAEKIQYNVYEENRVLKAKKQQKNNSRAKFRMIATLFFAFVIISAVIFRYAMITDINYDLVKANKNYEDIKNKNAILKVDIEKGTNLQKVREIAENKLGMQKPDKYQIIYVDVPKDRYSVVSETYQKKHEDSNFFTYVCGKIGQITSLLD